MRKICKDNNIPTPNYTVISKYDKKQLQKAIKLIGIPCVIKPIFGAESYGTIKIEKGFDVDQILEEVKKTTAADQKETFKNFTGNFLIEEYLPGKVISVDGIVQNFQPHFAGMVEFVMGPEPKFVQEANFIPPCTISTKQIKTCVAMAKRIIKTLGFNNCGFHCEMRITPSGPVLLEIAARLPGGPLQPGYFNAKNIDLTSLLIDIWLGQKIQITNNKNQYVLQKAYFPRQNGKLLKISGISSIKKDPVIWEFVQIAKEGDEIIENQTPLYYYALKEKNKKTLLLKSQEIENKIKILLG